MLYILSQVFGWIATVFRASCMIAKKPMTVKWLVSIGNLGWAISGVLIQNIPLIVSNVLCLIVMVVEIIRNKKGGKDKQMNNQDKPIKVDSVKKSKKRY